MSNTLREDSLNFELFYCWCTFWGWVWFGAVVGGSAFGFVLMLVVTLIQSPLEALAGALIGLYIGAIWASAVGLFVIPNFALLTYICFCNRRPHVLACLGGGLIGTFSLPPLFFVTAPVGAFSAYYFAKRYLNTPDSWLLREAEERRIANKDQPFNFTIASLFARTAGAAVLIAFWTLVVRILFTE